MIPQLESRNWEVVTGAGNSFYELTPEFCVARKTTSTGSLERPFDDDIADCWKPAGN